MKTLLFSFAILLICSIVVGQAQASSTAEKLQKVKEDKKRTENKLENTEQAIEGLKDEKNSLKGYLSNLNAELESATAELDAIETLAAQKQAEILEAERLLEDAIIQEELQYEAMKVRIKYMYERSDNAYLEFFFNAKSFVDFLNKAEYFEKIAKYDREMLEEYARVQGQVVSLKEKLVEEEEALTVLQGDAAKRKEEVSGLVLETHGNVQQYLSEISQAEKDAIAYENEIRQKDLEAADLQEQLNAEIELSRKSAAGQMRDLSNIQFDASDEDLLAAIIECEAGGESYTGKVAVGAVVMNRLKSSVFPDTVAGVIYQNKQFSPVGSGRFAVVLARGANASCYEAAREAMQGMSPVGGCVFFRTPIPGLSGIQIGGHIFY